MRKGLAWKGDLRCAHKVFVSWIRASNSYS